MKLSIKKYSSLLLAAPALFMMQACDKNFEETNTNPNAITTPTAEYIFSKAQYDALKYNATKGAMLLGTMQYTTSYNDVEGFGSKYVSSQITATSSFFTNSYLNQINEIGEVIKAVKDVPAKINMYAEARIWRVFCFSRLTDLYGDIPYSQAGEGYNQSNFQPVYDTQKDIYANMLKELEEAAKSLDATNTKTFGASDLVYGGKTDQWKKFAYSQMLRLGMRMTKIDLAGAQAWVTKAIAGGVITTFEDIAKMNYLAAGQDINKNYVAFQLLNDNYIKADGVSNTEGGKYQQAFIDSLKANNDPRLKVLSVVYVNGVANSDPAIQKGMPANINGAKPANFVTFSEPKQSTVLNVASPLVLLGLAETNFLLAEAASRGWYATETPAALYEKAIRASMRQWDLTSGVTGVIPSSEIDAYVATHQLSNAATQDQKIAQIYTQFWVSIFPDAQEAYSSYRRTGYPALVPNNYPGNATGGKIFRRFIYPANEQVLNTAAYNAAVARQGTDDLLTRVWWDKQ